MRRLALFFLLFLALGWLAVVVAQTVDPHSEVFNFRNGFQVGGGTTITGAAGTGNAAVVLPKNSVGLGAEVSGFAQPVIFCGDLPNATTTYFGPGLGSFAGIPTDYTIAGAACSALDSTTEATADTPISTLATRALGFRCIQTVASGANETTTYTLRTAAADAVTTDGGATALTCSIAGATATECRTVAGSTVDIAASATVAIKVVASANLSAQDGWCSVLVAWP
jgi:hypothetical protein